MFLIPKVQLLRLIIALAALAGFAQQRAVDGRKTYERVYAVAPVVGAGTPADPKRPKYAPAPGATGPKVRAGIIGYHSVQGDDGMALVEFVASDLKSVRDLLGDSGVKAFVRGRDSMAAMQAEFLKHKKDFDFTRFGVVMP